MNPLPPGQVARADFPRFGLNPYAARFPKELERVELRVCGHVATKLCVSDELLALPRVEQRSDFHCVTTWSRRDLRWSGVRFRDFYEQIVLPQARPEPGVRAVALRCQDGYRACLLLEDLLADDVLLADRLDGAPLGIEHGAPLRLVAPAHYGYKSAKHVSTLEFLLDASGHRTAALKFMEHPRARVVLEERGIGFPGVALRYLYRPLIGMTVRRFARELARFRAGPDA